MSYKETTGVPTGGLLATLRGPLIVYFVCLTAYGAVMWDRLSEPSRDNHYVHLADGILDGRLHLEGKPPHRNDWARFEDRWYVSFPPAPAILMIPGVAIWGLDFNDRAFTLVFAAAAPALLFLLLQMLSGRGRFDRKRRDLWLLSALYAFGTVYFFSAVQGSVWYTAQVVGSVMVILFMIFSVDARRPILAGLCLGLAFACRPSLLMAFPFYVYEVLRPHAEPDLGLLRWTWTAIRGSGFGRLLKKASLFALPVLVILGLFMVMNWARWGDPLDFGHEHLQVKQTARISKWGLFHYHYLARNLGVVLTSLPWISSEAPHLKVSMHGLALWFTTPVFLWALWPKTRSATYSWLAIALLTLAIPTLMYQNSGWVQFGQRFSLDYTPVLILMLALGGRRFGKLFIVALAFAVVVNLFGALTFDREWKYYAGGKNRDRVYQPH